MSFQVIFYFKLVRTMFFLLISLDCGCRKGRRDGVSKGGMEKNNNVGKEERWSGNVKN